MSSSSRELDTFLSRLKCEFDSIYEFVGPLNQKSFKTIARLCCLPSYAGYRFFDAIEKFINEPVITFESFEKFYRAMLAENDDWSSKLMFILTTAVDGKPRKYLQKGDLFPLFLSIISYHPCFEFLHDSPSDCTSFAQFCEELCFFTISGRKMISIQQLRASKFCDSLFKLDNPNVEPEDVDIVSFLQFCVVRFTFEEQELTINKTLMFEQMLECDNSNYNSIIIARMFQNHQWDGLSLSEYAPFLFAFIQKDHPSSIRFWFRLCDLDDDGYLTFNDLYELFMDIQPKMACQCENYVPCSAIDYLLKAGDCIKPITNVMTMQISTNDIIKSGNAQEFFDYFLHARDAYTLESSESRAPWLNEKSRWRVFCEKKYSLYTQNESKSSNGTNSAPQLDEDEKSNETNPILDDVVSDMLSCGFFGISA